MDYATAYARLERMTQAAVTPSLTAGELADLLLLARATDADGYAPHDAWAASTVYTVGQYRIPTTDNGHLYRATVAGTSGASQPTWSTTGGATVVDGGVTWQEYGAYLWTPTYRLSFAAGNGWLWKAAKVAAQYEVSVGSGKTFKRDQQWVHCMDMAASYGVGGGSGGGGGAGRLSSVPLGSATATGD